MVYNDTTTIALCTINESIVDKLKEFKGMMVYEVELGVKEDRLIRQYEVPITNI